jgi:hypothetical protein
VCIIKDAANDALDLFDGLVKEGGRRVQFDWLLCDTTVLLWLRISRTMLGASGGCMFVALKLPEDVSGHQNVKGAFVVIPIQFDPAVEIARSILGECMLGFESFDEMINVFVAFTFDSKIVDNKGE